MNRAEQIRQATLKAVAQRDAYVRQSVQQLNELYRQTAENISAQIKGDDARLLPMHELPLMLEAVRAAVQRLSHQRNQVLDKDLQNLAVMAGMPFVGYLKTTQRLLHADEAVAFVKNFVHADGLVLSERLWRLDKHASETLQQHLQAALIQGDDALHAIMHSMGVSQDVPLHIAKSYDAARAGTLRQSIHNILTGHADPKTGRGILYQAERLFRTELMRAHGEAYMMMAFDTDGIVGVRFMLSPRHPKPDICDTHASADLYGLGEGVYPNRSSCPWPAHPNTFSYVVAVFEDQKEQGSATISTKQKPLGQKGVEAEKYFTGTVHRIELDIDYEKHGLDGMKFSADDFIGLSGAPANSIIRVENYEIFTQNTLYAVPSVRQIYKDEDNGLSLYLYNVIQVIKDDYHRQNIATLSLRQQVRTAQKLGFTEIALFAAGHSGHIELNGYYAWPRLGFNMVLPSHLKPPAHLGDIYDVLDLMQTEEGREWWKNNGIEGHMVFDLSKGSKSLKVLEQYLQTKGLIL